MWFKRHFSKINWNLAPINFQVFWSISLTFRFSKPSWFDCEEWLYVTGVNPSQITGWISQFIEKRTKTLTLSWVKSYLKFLKVLSLMKFIKFSLAILTSPKQNVKFHCITEQKCKLRAKLKWPIVSSNMVIVKKFPGG